MGGPRKGMETGSQASTRWGTAVRHPVASLADALHCREGQASSLLAAGLVAAVLAAAGLPPVLAHRASAAAPAASAAGGATAAVTASPTTTSTQPPPVPPPATGGATGTIPSPLVGALGAAPPPLSPPASIPAVAPAPTPGPSATATMLRGREGTSLAAAVPVNGAVADVADNPGLQLTATVAWGDGSAPSQGRVSETAPGAYTVTAEHTYDEDGAYRITVTVTDDAGGVAAVTSQANVADPADALDQALDQASDAG
ncbi:MAG: PKD domain-containing protein [Acidimicrobiia bacterium]|nr:PKD domain-containing protein [Acidimicrobiia bacterium]